MTQQSPPRWFTFAAIAAILFEIVGVGSFLLDVMRTPKDLATLPVNQQLMWAATPRWVYGAYAVAVFIGLAGAIGLILRRMWSIPLLGLSLLAVLIQFGGVMMIPRWRALTTPDAIVVPMMIVIVCALIYVLAHRAHHRGWLR